MPQINISLKEGASPDQLESAKKQVTEQGGKIEHEFKLVKGFTYVGPLLRQTRGHKADEARSASFPADKVHSLSSNEHINVEADGEVKTQ
ncbi:hypothetical protein LTR95_001969 [Oleoguttula sp. CCFEE 5521]